MKNYLKEKKKLCKEQNELRNKCDVIDDKIKKLDEEYYKSKLKNYLGNCYNAHQYISKYVRCERVDEHGQIRGTIICVLHHRTASIDFDVKIDIKDDLYRSRKISHKCFNHLLDDDIQKLKSYKTKKLYHDTYKN